MPVRLPSAKDAKLEHNLSALSAYNVCLALEDRCTTDENRMHARILGYLILNAPSGSTNALAEIARVIHSYSQDDQKLLDLGKCFCLWFILPFKKANGRTPAPSDHPSRPSFDRLKEDLKATITEVPKDHRQAKAQALIRDHYQCVVTGQYDLIAYEESIIDVKTITAAGFPVHTELAHISPESACFGTSNTRGSSPEQDYSVSVFAVMQRFGYDVEKVKGEKVHSLYNVMTMQKDAHDWFDRLEMWFESTDVVNRYRVQTIWPVLFGAPKAEVTFTSPNSVIYPVPSPQLLALHAACAKVAHLSGAGEYIDKLDRDTDDLGVLATDGSSSAILTHALWKSITSPVGIEA